MQQRKRPVWPYLRAREGVQHVGVHARDFEGGGADLPHLLLWRRLLLLCSRFFGGLESGQRPRRPLASPRRWWQKKCQGRRRRSPEPRRTAARRARGPATTWRVCPHSHALTRCLGAAPRAAADASWPVESLQHEGICLPPPSLGSARGDAGNSTLSKVLCRSEYFLPCTSSVAALDKCAASHCNHRGTIQFTTPHKRMAGAEQQHHHHGSASQHHLEVSGNDDSESSTLLSHQSASSATSPSKAMASANVIVAIAYGVASVVTTLANKALLSSWGFGLVFSLLFMQNFLTVAVVAVVRPWVRSRCGGDPKAGILAAGATNRWHDEFSFPLWDRELAVVLMPVMLMCVANLWAGMSALRLSSVPVYQTLKRMTPLPAMALDACLRGKRFSLAVSSSVVVVCFGAFVTGCGDLDFQQRGYAFACASCCLQALYLVLASRARDSRHDVTSTCASYYNALLSLPLLAAGVYYEHEPLLSFPHWGRPDFLGMLLTDLVLGASLSLLLFACTLTNSALTTTIVGNAKAVFTTMLGAILFGKVALDALGWLGVCINTAGGVLYSVAKYRESANR